MIPVELWDTIIRLVCPDKKTLSNCSLVCRCWSPIARRYRFREISIIPRASLSPSLLCDPTSTILPYVHQIRLQEGLRTEDRGDIRMAPSDRDAAPWFDDILSKIRVQDLVALEGLIVMELLWEKLSIQSRRNFVDLCKRVVSLQLHSSDAHAVPCSVVLELLSATTTLQQFSILAVREPPADEMSLDPPLRTDDEKISISLQQLTINGGMYFYLPGLLAASTLHLSEVSLPIITERDEVDLVISFLQSCSSTLARVSLRFGETMSWDDDDLRVEPEFCARGGLSCLTSLESLRLEAHLQHLPAILWQIRSPVLARLVMDVEPRMLAGSDLDELARSISTGTFAPARPRVTFICTPEFDPFAMPPIASLHQGLNMLRDALVATFKDLQEEGRLRFLRIVIDPEIGLPLSSSEIAEFDVRLIEGA